MNISQQALSTLMSTDSVSICGVDLAPIEYRGARVMTLGMMDDVHKRPEGTAGRNFRENRTRLIEGEDFHELNQPDEIRRAGFSRPQGGTPAMVLLLTETGYSMLVKSFTDDLAWDVQRQLVKSYFNPVAKSVVPNFADEIEAGEAWLAAKKEAREQAALAKVEAEKAKQLEHQVAELAPAAAGLDRIANADDAMCVTDAAKTLQLAPRKLRDLLLEKKWMYPRAGKSGHVAYQDKIHAGYLKHKYGNYQDPESGEWKTSAQVLVTSKGIAKLSKILSTPPAPPSPEQRQLN